MKRYCLFLCSYPLESRNCPLLMKWKPCKHCWQWSISQTVCGSLWQNGKSMLRSKCQCQALPYVPQAAEHKHGNSSYLYLCPLPWWQHMELGALQTLHRNGNWSHWGKPERKGFQGKMERAALWADLVYKGSYPWVLRSVILSYPLSSRNKYICVKLTKHYFENRFCCTIIWITL